MSNGMKLHIVMQDGATGDFVVTPKVQVMFEREFGGGIGKALMTDQKVEHLYWLAWKSMHAAGRSVKPFDSWLDEVVDVQIVEEQTAPFDETA